MQVLLAQISRYENQPVHDGLGKSIGWIKNDMEELGKLSSNDLIDLAGRMVKNAKGEAVFNFGKHKNKPVLTVFKEEPSYYDWMMNGDFPLDTKRRLTELKLKSLVK
jgi:DNA polymerase-3 subunit epsilon